MSQGYNLLHDTGTRLINMQYYINQ